MKIEPLDEGQIAELFIRAAEVERAMPEHVGPSPVRSMNLPYVHDWVDKLGWGKTRGDQLIDDPLEEERKAFWDRLGLRASSAELSRLERLRDLLMMVHDEKQRRALLAWARSKVGGKSFKTWCFKVEGIHPETGRRRKDRAIASIAAQIGGSVVQNCEMQSQGVLPETPSDAYLEATFEEVGQTKEREFSWRADPSLKLVVDEDAQKFSWAEKRNARRRQQAAKRQNAA